VKKLFSIYFAIFAALLLAAPARAQTPPALLPEPVIAALAEELSGETAKRNLEYVSRHHRTRASRQFRAAAEFLAAQARSYGLSDAQVLQFPADGKTMFGTQKSRPAWDADFAELWELRREGEKWVPSVRLGSWDAMPLSLAQDSESADVKAELVDVGEGTAESDYAGKDVRGKIVLAAAQPGAVARLAVDKYGAAGIVSYAQNQRTAWWGEDENLVRWGHLDSFTAAKTFGFMVSLKRARELRQRLARGETIRLHAKVEAGRRPGNYDIVTATIPGADPRLRNEEIVFSCHLDHPRPGANDNASGCVTILEVARTLSKLIAEGKLERPARTIRFIWPPEIEGTVILLNARPELAARIKAVVHMDMVGGGPETKAIFHVTRGPMSLPSFIHDVAEAFAGFVNQQSEQFAKTGAAKYPFIAPEGGKEPLRAEFAEFSSGSDHQVYTEGSWRIPAIYLKDWPDRYIHTNFDSAAMIDPTKLKRAGFIGAASAYFLAAFRQGDEAPLLNVIESHRLLRLSRTMLRASHLSLEEAANSKRHALLYETGVLASLESFLPRSVLPRSFDQVRELAGFLGVTDPEPAAAGQGALVFSRNPEPKGPMSVFGYDYFEDHCRTKNVCEARLLRYRGLWGSGGEYAYEALNFVDGKRNAQQIRDVLSAAYGPVPLDIVVEYLRALEAIGVLRAASR
jgi:aminopeptidase YwaD